MSAYYEKYLKYKAKYLELKNQFGGSGSMNVNLVIDVQNCFMFGGSFKTSNAYGPKTGSVESDINLDLGQTGEILALIALKPGYTVMTRDFHPYGHSSIISSGKPETPPNTWTSHCVDRNSVCLRGDIGDADEYLIKTPADKTLLRDYIAPTRFKDRLVKPEYGEIPIVGNEVSSMYYINNRVFTPIIEQIRAASLGPKIQLLHTNLAGGGTALISAVSGTTRHRTEEPDSKHIRNVAPVPFVQLLKGQYCSYDANSAFNYHSHYTRGGDGKIVMSAVPVEERYTTGLFEYIIAALAIENAKGTPITVLNINVCGNVGNVCVIHTILQGLVMLRKVYSGAFAGVSVQFNFFMTGTRFAPFYVESVGEYLGRFDAKPNEGRDERVGATFVEMLQTYSNALRGSSFVEADRGLLSGLGFNVIGYDAATVVGRVSFA